MLTISEEQEEFFKAAASDAFIALAVEHLKNSFPEAASSLGDAGMKRFIQAGVRRAARWKIETARNVCVYLDLMVTLGADFDRDPRLPWVRRILGSDVRTETERIDHLYASVIGMLNKLQKAV